VKRVTGPEVEPDVLRQFRHENPNGTWDEFKQSSDRGEVFDALADSQGYLCAYCEIRIARPLKGQVEHFEPKSTGAGRSRHLEMTNMLATCEGGVRPWQRDRSETPISDTMHCGQLKENKSPAGEMLDPRAIPIAPLIWNVTPQGKLTVNQIACVAAGEDPSLAERTLEFLGLNRRVLIRKRRRILTELYQVHDTEPFVPEVYLLPDPDGQLNEFWTTIRSFGGVQSDSFVIANADRVPGLDGSR
jgi:uncharacterized protein (TIGR02646 family)